MEKKKLKTNCGRDWHTGKTLFPSQLGWDHVTGFWLTGLG